MRGRVKWANLFLSALLLLAGGCQRQPAAEGPSDASAENYAGRGVVQKIATDWHTVTIAHEAIPGYMMAMTMDFPVKDTNELMGLSPGDVVTFNLVVRKDEDWVNHLQRTGQTGPIAAPSPPMAVDELKPADAMPDFAFTTEQGTRGHLADFRGQAVAFTFFFTSCPLPDYCPRMNKNFATARQLILSGAHAPTNWEFLSISFDSGFDSPEILSNYAGLYRGEDTNHWLFAVIGTNTLAAIAPRLDLMVMHSSSGISHNLRTVVLDPQGRIYRQFDGNQWTPGQLAEAVTEAAHAH
jgi:protein SCO1/2